MRSAYRVKRVVIVSVLVCLWLNFVATFSPQRVQAYVDISPHRYLQDQGLIPLWGDTHNHAHFDDGVCGTTKLFQLALAAQDFVIHTPHAEQVSKTEANELRYQVELWKQKGKLLGIGYEWTGSTETGQLYPRGLTRAEFEKMKKTNPAYAESHGHVLVYGTQRRIGRGSVDGGIPDREAWSFLEMLGALNEDNDAIGVFAHPALYKVEKSFDLDGEPPGYDPPPSPEAIRVMKGCELVNHAPPGMNASSGLGDGVTLRTSNEACYRRLLRGGWRLSPYMGTDWHYPGYKAGPWTGVFVRERSINAVYDAMEERMTFATEVKDVSIALMAWEEDFRGTLLSPITPMGSTLTLSGHANFAKIATSLRDRQGRPLVPKTMGTVVLFPEDAEFPVLGSLYSCKYAPTLLHYSDTMDEWDSYGLASQGAICAYAVATLENGKQLISAPVFFRH